MTLLQLIPFKKVVSRWNRRCAIPLNIDLIDEVIGGLLPYHLHMVRGDTGVGKTWFCIRAINNLFKQRPDAQVLYSDFCGHLRISNLKKILSSSCQLEQITIFQPNNLLEQIIFFRNLLDNPECSYDLIVLDSLFGSPIDLLQYFYKESKFWKKRIFSHFLDLKRIARESKIPILLTNHSMLARDISDASSHLNQYGGHMVEQFVPIDVLIQKTEQKSSLEVRIFQEIVGCTDFKFMSNNFTEK
ncbi:MAG: hypothetical protein ACXADY_03405 [Candidatus Hodarchaeales archaeon]|jgi:archaellum biogenesis ATPase FlaH